VSDAAIETRGLHKRFGTTIAVDELSLAVGRGEVFGFLGPNGAGKTTSVKMLLGLVAPTRGDGTVLGQPLGDRETRAKIGFLPEHFRFQDSLTARELLRYHGRLFGLRGAALDARIDALEKRGDAKAKETAATLRAKRDQARAKLSELDTRTQENWTAFKKDVSDAWDQLDRDVTEATR